MALREERWVLEHVVGIALAVAPLETTGILVVPTIGVRLTDLLAFGLALTVCIAVLEVLAVVVKLVLGISLLNALIIAVELTLDVALFDEIELAVAVALGETSRFH